MWIADLAAASVNGELMRGRRGNAGEYTGLLSPEAREARPTLTLLRKHLESTGEHYTSPSDMIAGVRVSSRGVEQWIERTIPAANTIISAIGAILDPDAIVIGAGDARLWIHGHTYTSRGYQAGTTRIVCNPKDYGPWTG